MTLKSRLFATLCGVLFAGCSAGSGSQADLPQTSTGTPLSSNQAGTGADSPTTLATVKTARVLFAAATTAPAAWTTIFGGYNSSTQIYTKRSTTDPCGFVPATASSAYKFPTALKAGLSLSIVGQLVKSDGSAIASGACPYQILNVTSITGTASSPTPAPSPKPTASALPAPSPSPTGTAVTSASNYWVSTTGADSNNGTSTATAFRTIQHAQGVAKPGQTVTVRDGTYTDCGNCVGVNYSVLFTHGGTSASARITYRSEHKWGAVIDGTAGAGARRCFGFNDNLAWITLDGFHLQNCLGGIAGLGNAHDILVTHMNIERIGKTGNCGTNGGGGFTGIGWTEAYNVVVDGNVIHDVGEPHNAYSCSYTNDHGIYAHGHDNTIINNIFYNNNSGWDIQLAGGPTAHNWLIANNTFGARNDAQAPGNVVIWTSSGPNTPSNITFENNISGATVGTALLNCIYGSGTSGLIARNNVVSANVALLIGGCSANSSNNRFGVAPMFVNPTLADFHLQTGSLARSSGEYNARVPDNFDGTPRTTPFSSGAY